MEMFLGITATVLILLTCVALSALLVAITKESILYFQRRRREWRKTPSSTKTVLQKPYHWRLYILKLEDSKYYVGITSKTPEVRMKEHITGIRSAYWTAKHTPLEIIHTEDLGVITKSQAERRENKMVRACMKERGLNNVRGGDLTSTEEYIARFGYIFIKETWDMLCAVIVLLGVILYLSIDRLFF